MGLDALGSAAAALRQGGHMGSSIVQSELLVQRDLPGCEEADAGLHKMGHEVQGLMSQIEAVRCLGLGYAKLEDEAHAAIRVRR